MSKVAIGASFEVVISTDALFYIFMHEQPLDDEAIIEAEELLGEWPEGLYLYDYELIPDDYRAVATIAPYLTDRQKPNYTPSKRLSSPVGSVVLPEPMEHLVNDTFNPEQYLYFGPVAAWEIKVRDDIVFCRIAKFRKNEWQFGEVVECELKTNSYGFDYFQYSTVSSKSNAPGTILYIKDFKWYGE